MIGLALADLDADGRLDLIVGGAPAQLLARLGKGDGTFAPAAGFPTGCCPELAATADFDADGRIDLATDIFSDENVVGVLLNRCR